MGNKGDILLFRYASPRDLAISIHYSLFDGITECSLFFSRASAEKEECPLSSLSPSSGRRSETKGTFYFVATQARVTSPSQDIVPYLMALQNVPSVSRGPQQKKKNVPFLPFLSLPFFDHVHQRVVGRGSRAIGGEGVGGLTWGPCRGRRRGRGGARVRRTGFPRRAGW